jgi:hypothetical protein
MSNDALTLARELGHPFSMAFALCFAAQVHRLRGEVQPARELAEAATAFSTEHGMQLWLAVGTFERGWALAQLEHFRG